MADVAITPIQMDGELRILDVNLADRLGFAQPRDIRKIIARHRGALSKMGAVTEIAEIVGKGQKAKTYYLNKKQAIFITAKSETPEATDITIEIIHKFDAYEKGQLTEVELPPRNYHEWSLEQVRTKLAVVNMYRHTLNVASAAWAMQNEGFPMPPAHLLPAYQREIPQFEFALVGRVR